jgi:hypothetical protein
VNNRSEMKSNLVVRVFGLELVLEPMLWNEIYEWMCVYCLVIDRFWVSLWWLSFEGNHHFYVQILSIFLMSSVKDSFDIIIIPSAKHYVKIDVDCRSWGVLTYWIMCDSLILWLYDFCRKSTVWPRFSLCYALSFWPWGGSGCFYKLWEHWEVLFMQYEFRNFDSIFVDLYSLVDWQRKEKTSLKTRPAITHIYVMDAYDHQLIIDFYRQVAISYLFINQFTTYP